MGRPSSEELPIAVRQYASARGVSSFDEIVKALKTDCRQLLARQKSPPIFLHDPFIKERQRIDDIRQVNLAIDGRIFPRDDGSFIIEVNAHSSPGRQNFTLAHEIGHTFFLPYEPSERNRRADKSVGEYSQKDSEERLCDIVAAELLMPERIFRDFTQDWGPSVESILSLSRLFKCSVIATSRRFVEIGGWNVSICSWRLHQHEGKGFTREWSHTTNSLGLYLPKRSEPQHIPFLESVWATETLQRDHVDLGFQALGRVPVSEKYFTQAFSYGIKSNKRILSVTIFDRYAKQLGNQYRIVQQRDGFYRDHRSAQLELPFD